MRIKKVYQKLKKEIRNLKKKWEKRQEKKRTEKAKKLLKWLKEKKPWILEKRPGCDHKNLRKLVGLWYQCRRCKKIFYILDSVPFEKDELEIEINEVLRRAK